MKVVQRPSKYGNIIFEITFANTNNEIAHTYIDEDNANFRRWEDIIKGFDQGLGIIVNGLKIKKNAVHKRTGEPLVNADSLVSIPEGHKHGTIVPVNKKTIKDLLKVTNHH